MPTRAERDQAKEARRQKIGITEDLLLDLAAAPTVGYEATPAQWSVEKRILHELQRFIGAFKPEELVELLPPNITTAEQLLVPSAPLLSFECTVALFHCIVNGAPGQLANTLSIATVRSVFDGYCALVRRKTGRGPSTQLRSSVNAWIQTTLREECGLHKETREKGIIGEETLLLLVKSFFDAGCNLPNFRSRILMTDWVAIHVAESLRIGGLVNYNSGEKGHKIPWLWKHLTINIMKSTTTTRNDVAITTTAPNYKTANDKAHELIFTRADYLWADRVILTLVLATYAQAFPVGYTIQSLFDPNLFGPTSPRVIELKFADSAKDLPVLGAVRDPSLPLNQARIRRWLRAASRSAGLDFDVRPHTLRRSGAALLASKGQFFILYPACQAHPFRCWSRRDHSTSHAQMGNYYLRLVYKQTNVSDLVSGHRNMTDDQHYRHGRICLWTRTRVYGSSDCA